MRFLYTLISCLIVSTSFAQKATNRIIVSYTQKYYFNKLNLDNDEQTSSNITTKNLSAPAIGLDFERTTKHNIIFDIGLDYGIQTHDLYENCDLSNFDADAPMLKDVTWSNNIRVTTHYISPRILIGYKKQLSKDFALIGKGE